MATAVQKIILSSSRDIPFNKLVLSQSNVRRVKAGVSIEELAESIARRGLIQSLHVRPFLDADGAEDAAFFVQAVRIERMGQEWLHHGVLNGFGLSRTM